MSDADAHKGDRKFFYFQAIRVKAEVWADNEEHAKRRVQECVDLTATKHVPQIWMEPMKGEPLVYDW